MTTGSTENADAVLLRDLARAGGPEGIAESGVRVVVPSEAAAELAALRAWVETVLDRVPEAYGDRDQPEAIIDRWLGDLVAVYETARALTAKAQPGRELHIDGPILRAETRALRAAVDRVRTDETEVSDGDR